MPWFRGEVSKIHDLFAVTYAATTVQRWLTTRGSLLPASRLPAPVPHMHGHEEHAHIG